MVWIKGGAAAARLGVSIRTLRLWDAAGKIPTLRTPGGTRLYDVNAFLAATNADDPHSEPASEPVADPRVAIAYCRVSSAGQKADLERQVAHMRERCPEAEIVKDVGSGLNFKRKGLKAVLERAMQGTLRSVTVA